MASPLIGTESEPSQLPSPTIEELQRLKHSGNSEFIKNTEAGYKQSCLIYGQVLSGMMEYEDSIRNKSSSETSSGAFSLLKPTIFLNLAAANLQLGGLEACFKCCNAAALFINNPDFLLDEMGLGENSEDISDLSKAGIPIKEPVLPGMQSLAEKALYRRGKCLIEMGGLHVVNAAKDLYAVLRISAPSSTQLQRAVRSALQSIEKEKNQSYCGTTTIATSVSGVSDSDDHVSTTSATSTVFSSSSRMLNKNRVSKSAKLKNRNNTSHRTTLQEMTVNGGFCLRRRGNWAQSVRDATVYFRLDELISFPRRINEKYTDCNDQDSELEEVDDFRNSRDWKVEFDVDTIVIKYRDEYLLLPQCLEYNINVSSSLWMLEDFSTTELPPTGRLSARSDEPTHLVLYLSKAPSVEWFPGCEWWDRVFVDDEPIDTSTCSIAPGSYHDELPPEARLNADLYHARFTKLSVTEQTAELSYLSQGKKDLYDASRTLDDTEATAYSEEPEREEMVNALRAEFPKIFFTSK